METLIKDIRFAVRSFLKRPGFLVIAVATLALGIGATTVMFTVVTSVLLRPLQFPEPERIVLFYGINPRQGITRSNMSMPDIVDWQKQASSFEQIAGFVSGGLFLSAGDETERVRGTGVSGEFFQLFKTNPVQGRTLQAADMQPGGEPVVVISYALWQRRFGGATSVVNSKVMLNGKAATIVGVMPAGFTYPADCEAWTAFPLTEPDQPRDNRFISVVTRLKPGVSMSQAQTEMDTINQRLAQNYGETNSGWTVRLLELRESLVGELRTSLLILLGGCGNVPGDARNLRCHFLLRDATDARDRCAYGARRADCRRAEARVESCDDTRRDRDRDWCCRCDCVDAVFDDAVVWREADRRGDVCWRRIDFDARGVCRVSRSGAKSHEDRSIGSTEIKRSEFKL